MGSSLIKTIITGTSLGTATSEHGCIKIPIIKKIIIWDNYPTTALTHDAASNAYMGVIDLSSYGLTGNVWGLVSSSYPGGFPRTGISALTTTSIKILCDVSLATAYVFWLVIADYS